MSLIHLPSRRDVPEPSRERWETVASFQANFGDGRLRRVHVLFRNSHRIDSCWFCGYVQLDVADEQLEFLEWVSAGRLPEKCSFQGSRANVKEEWKPFVGFDTAHAHDPDVQNRSMDDWAIKRTKAFGKALVDAEREWRRPMNRLRRFFGRKMP